MKRILSLLTLTLTLIALSSTAVLAQELVPEVGVDAAKANNEVVARVTEYDYEDDQVTGALDKPLGERINPELHGKLKSLVTVKGDFVNEMIESTDAL